MLHFKKDLDHILYTQKGLGYTKVALFIEFSILFAFYPIHITGGITRSNPAFSETVLGSPSDVRM